MNKPGMNFKYIHIGSLIELRVKECDMDISRISNFFSCKEEEILEVYRKTDLDTHLLLKWSKLLEYDFFRLYTQHLILYSPASTVKQKELSAKASLPTFRKNIYTKEVIDFILQQIKSGEMSKNKTIEKYKIPKTTLYKWIEKYGK